MSDDPKYAAPVDNFPQKGSSGSGDDILYSVQARLAYHDARLICGHLLDLRWKTLYFEKSPIGVPAARPFRFGAMATGLLSYQAAQALRWWFLAEAETNFSCLCVETRLVEHRVSYSYSSEAIRAVAPIGSDDRSNTMPDWGKKEVFPAPPSEDK